MSGVAWVTGASQGLGAAVALHLAENGWTVAASARSADGLKALADDPRAGGRIHAIPCDVTDGAANAAAVAQIESELGPIALAILNAGTHHPLRFRDLDAAVFQKLFLGYAASGPVLWFMASEPSRIAVLDDEDDLDGDERHAAGDDNHNDDGTDHRDD